MGMQVLRLEPGDGFGQFAGRGGEGEAIRDVEAAVTEGEELRLEKVGAIERTQDEHLAPERFLEAALPAGRKEGRERARPVVQPLVLERATAGADLGRKGSRCGHDFPRQRRVEDVAIPGLPLDDTEQVES